MNGSDKQWKTRIASGYAQHVYNNPAEGVPLDGNRNAAGRDYAEAVTNGEPRWQVDLEAEGRMLFDQAVGPIRKQRRTNFTRDCEYLLDALNDDTVLGNVDPLLDQPFPLGTPDGRDKTLRFWTWDDWDNARLERNDVAVRAQVAATRFNDQVAEKFIALLQGANVRRTGDLFIADFYRDDETQTDIA